jgi:CRP/FNR family transcriptional regulator, anaerobic regulatory protein
LSSAAVGTAGGRDLEDVEKGSGYCLEGQDMPTSAPMLRETPGYPLHRFAALGRLTADDQRDLRQLGQEPVSRRRGDVIWTEGQPTSGIHLLIDGWVSSSVGLRSGKRLIQKLHLPGDMLGTPSMVLPVAADTLVAVTQVTTSFVPLETLKQVFVSKPRLTALLLMAVQLERLILMDALAGAGHASAMENMARFLLDLHQRLSGLGAVQQDEFELPVTQDMLGDLLGLTTIHVNRTLRGMAEQGLIGRQGRRIRLLNLPALRRLSPLPARIPVFEPGWLPGGNLSP